MNETDFASYEDDNTHSSKGLWNKLAKYEKLGKYWSYCSQNRAITNAYIVDNNIEDVIINLQNASLTHFQWFYDNQIKARSRNAI